VIGDSLTWITYDQCTGRYITRVSQPTEMKKMTFGRRQIMFLASQQLTVDRITAMTAQYYSVGRRVFELIA